jgi:hypothetical protein
MKTPWGNADSTEHLPGGIILASTSSHGGYYVPPALLPIIPEAWRAASWRGLGNAGWFEEDCDWCMVALAFPTVFPADAQTAARKTFDCCIAKKLAA